MQSADALLTTFARALEVALECRQGRIAPVHLAIAALELPDPLTADVLRALGVAPEEHAAALRASAPVGAYEVGPAWGPDLGYTDAGRRAFWGCRTEAAALGHRFVHPLHLLLAILRDRTTQASRALGAAGLEYDALRSALRAEVP